jgi:hypothetical protein
MGPREEIGKAFGLEAQRKKRCREGDISLPACSKRPLLKTNRLSAEMKSGDLRWTDRWRRSASPAVDHDRGVSDWVESEMRNISKRRGIVQPWSNGESSPGKRSATLPVGSKMTLEESLRRLEELQKLIEEDEVKLKSLQEQSDQCFNRLMSDEENWKHYIDWRARNGLEVPKDLHSAFSMQQQPSILLPSGRSAFSPTAAIMDALQVGRPTLDSTMDRITPFSDLLQCTDEFPYETDTLGKFAV